MLYSMNTGLNGIAEFKRVMIAAGLLGTIHYESTTIFIFSTIRSNKVIRVTNFLLMSVGDSYTSGTVVNNPVTVFNPYFNSAWVTGSIAYLVVTPDILAFCHASPTDVAVCHSIIFGRLDNTEYIIITSTSSGTGADASYPNRWYNSSINEILMPVFTARTPTIDSLNNFHTFDMPFKNESTNIYRAGKIVGAKWIFKPPITSEPIQIFNPDILISMQYERSSLLYSMNCSLLVIGGNI